MLAIVVAIALAIGAAGSAHASSETSSHPFTSIEYTVLPPTGDAPKAAPFANNAGVGDRIRITATAERELDMAPRIYLPTSPTLPHYAWHVMEAGSDPNTWTYEFTVQERVLATHSTGAYTYVYSYGHLLWFQISNQRGAASHYTVHQSDFEEGLPMHDPSSPRVIQAGFRSPDTIWVHFTERFSTGSTFAETFCAIFSGCSFKHTIQNKNGIEALAYRVTAPDGTNAPDDADTDPDVIDLRKSGVKYWGGGTRSYLLVKLQEPAVPGVTYTLELPDALRDSGGNRFLDSTVEVTRTASFTARTIDATTTIVTFSGDVGGSISKGSWHVSRDHDPYALSSPYTIGTYKGISYLMSDKGSWAVNSATLGPPEDAPALHFKRDYWTWVAEFQEGADSPSSWWGWNVSVGIPDTYSEQSLTLKHPAISPTDSLHVSFLQPTPFYHVYMYPGTGDASSPPYFIPWRFYTDFVDDADSMRAMRAGGAVVPNGIVASADAWPPTFTARQTSTTTTAIEFSESMSGTARIADWALAEGALPRAIQSVRVGLHSSAEDASARAASASLSSATTITLTHEESRPWVGKAAVSYTRPAASATDALADIAGNYLATSSVTARGHNMNDITPPTFTASTVSTTLVRITFAEPVSGNVYASEWKVGGTAASSVIMPSGLKNPQTALLGEVTLDLVVDPIAHDARPTVTFTPPSPPTLVDWADNGIAAATVTAADGTPPIVTLASTASTSTVTVTFSEAVSGTTNYNEWRVGGSTPTLLKAGAGLGSDTLELSGVTELTLVTGIDLEPDSTPTITYTPPASTATISIFKKNLKETPTTTYTPPGSTGLTDTVSSTAPSHETATPMAAQSLVAVDGIAPAPAASFAGPREITVTFDEALAAPETIAGLSYAVTVPDGAADEDSDPDAVVVSSASYAGATRTLTLTLAADAAAGVEHTVTLPSSGLSDEMGNAVTTTTLTITRAGAAAPAFTARTVNATLVEVTFGSPVTGAVAPSQWTVAGTAASSLRAPQGSTTEVTSPTRATSLYPVTGALAAAARPAVASAPRRR